MPKVKKLKRALAHDTRVFQKYQNLLMELTRKNIKLKYRFAFRISFYPQETFQRYI